MIVGQSLLSDHARNGGFPEPLAGEPVRVIAARHDGCGEATRVRIPDTVPARAVRRVRCTGCAEEFAAEAVEEIDAGAAGKPPRTPLRERVSLPSFGLPDLSLPRIDPASRTWRLLSIPAAAALVIGGLLVIQGGGDSDPGAPDATATAPAEAPALEAPDESATGDAESNVGATGGEAPAEGTELVQGSSYHLLLPEGWKRIDPPAGATFAAAASDGSADATLWIRADARLDFLDFVERSREQLSSLTGNPPRTVEQVFAPTPEETIVRLAADSAPGAPRYEVLLRAAGEYRYSLSTTVEPGTSRETVAGVELMIESFTPEAGA